MPMAPAVYANLLGKKIAEHNVTSWLVNTGWSGGSYGAGSCMKIAYTCGMVRAALSGSLSGVPTEQDTVFCLHSPKSCPDVPADVLNPRNTWKDKSAYDARARELAEKFKKNFEQFASGATPEVRNAGPK